MFKFIKRMKERRARHVADVMQNEINPDEYLRREREMRRENIIEGISAVLLIPVVYLLVKLWFAYEGFEIQW